jgi:hypothetical protein
VRGRKDGDLRPDLATFRVSLRLRGLQGMFEEADIRLLSARDISAANRRHDEMLGPVRGLGMWQRHGRLPNGVSRTPARFIHTSG